MGYIITWAVNVGDDLAFVHDDGVLVGGELVLVAGQGRVVLLKGVVVFSVLQIHIMEFHGIYR